MMNPDRERLMGASLDLWDLTGGAHNAAARAELLRLRHIEEAARALVGWYGRDFGDTSYPPVDRLRTALEGGDSQDEPSE